ncbi:MAG: SDR family oxidoreductase [Pseudomonadota bacterium]
MRLLEGRRILVTGAGGGIGAAICRRLTEQGAEVIATDLDDNGADAAVSSGSHYHPLDVTDEAGWQAVAEDVGLKFGALEGLVNNAGIVMTKSIADMGLDDYRRVNAVNNDGVFLGIKYCTDLLARTELASGASVVNFSSLYGLGGQGFYTAYCASKGAVRLLTKAAASEFAQTRRNIRVNSVHPGVIHTNMTEAVIDELLAGGKLESREAALRAIASGLPRRTLGRPEQVADVVAFLLSDGSSYINGAEIPVDDGISAQAQ